MITQTIYTRSSKLGLMEYFFAPEIMGRKRYLRAFFRLPGIIAPSAEMDATAQYPGWYQGVPARTKDGAGYVIQYNGPDFWLKDDVASWSALLSSHGFAPGARFVSFAIDASPELDALYAEYHQACWLRGDIHSLVDERSRIYLTACLDALKTETHCGRADDDFDRAHDGGQEWTFEITHQDVDDAQYLAVRGDDAVMREARLIYDAVEAVADRGCIISCYECGKDSHWLDTHSDNPGLRGYLHNLTEQYCGC